MLVVEALGAPRGEQALGGRRDAPVGGGLQIAPVVDVAADRIHEQIDVVLLLGLTAIAIVLSLTACSSTTFTTSRQRGYLATLADFQASRISDIGSNPIAFAI
jgi:hypothetical protein